MARDNDESENGGGVSCLRISLVLVNFVSALVGLGGIGIGIWLFQHDGRAEDMSLSAPDLHSSTEGSSSSFGHDTISGYLGTGDFKSFSYVLLGLGAIITFVSGVGILGSCFKSRCLLVSYLSTVVLILILQILVAVFAFVYREPMATTLRQELLTNLREEYVMSPPSDAKLNWDMVQTKFQCCGVDGHSDWFKANAWPNNDYVPDSCCVSPNNTVAECGRSGDASIWHKQGCLEMISKFILEELHILASIVITLVFLQLFGIIASTLLFYHSKPPKPKSPQYKAYLYERARM